MAEDTSGGLVPRRPVGSSRQTSRRGSSSLLLLPAEETARESSPGSAGSSASKVRASNAVSTEASVGYVVEGGSGSETSSLGGDAGKQEGDAVEKELHRSGDTADCQSQVFQRRLMAGLLFSSTDVFICFLNVFLRLSRVRVMAGLCD